MLQILANNWVLWPQDYKDFLQCLALYLGATYEYIIGHFWWLGIKMSTFAFLWFLSLWIYSSTVTIKLFNSTTLALSKCVGLFVCLLPNAGSWFYKSILKFSVLVSYFNSYTFIFINIEFSSMQGLNLPFVLHLISNLLRSLKNFFFIIFLIS